MIINAHFRVTGSSSVASIDAKTNVTEVIANPACGQALTNFLASAVPKLFFLRFHVEVGDRPVIDPAPGFILVIILLYILVTVRASVHLVLFLRKNFVTDGMRLDNQCLIDLIAKVRFPLMKVKKKIISVAESRAVSSRVFFLRIAVRKRIGLR